MLIFTTMKKELKTVFIKWHHLWSDNFFSQIASHDQY